MKRKKFINLVCESTTVVDGKEYQIKDVRCGDVKGNVKASGDINCGHVDGKVYASGDVICKR
jgi:hypothetical protein